MRYRARIGFHRSSNRNLHPCAFIQRKPYWQTSVTLCPIRGIFFTQNSGYDNPQSSEHSVEQNCSGV
jgi:hypothetical protein